MLSYMTTPLRSKIWNISITTKSSLTSTLAAPLPHGQFWWSHGLYHAHLCVAQPDTTGPPVLHMWTVWSFLWLRIYLWWHHASHSLSRDLILASSERDLWTTLAWLRALPATYMHFFFFEIHEDLKNLCRLQDYRKSRKSQICHECIKYM